MPKPTLALALAGALSAFAQGTPNDAESPSATTASVPSTTSAAPDPSPDEVATTAPAGTNSHPFRQIPIRNAFGIKPPPPPPTPAPEPTPQPPPPPPSNVTLTGFSVWQGRKKVYLQISLPGSKAPIYRDMEEGEVSQEDIEIVSIDPRNETAKILNAGTEMVLNFKDNGAKSAPSAGTPGAPGAIPTPVINTPATANFPRNTGPTVIGRGGMTENPAAQGVIPNPVAQPVNTPVDPATGSMPTLPSRRVRSDAAPATPSGPILQPGQERIINGRVIPPPPPIPIPVPGE